VGDQYYVSPNIPQLPFIRTGVQQQPYVSHLFNVCDMVKTHEWLFF
jgi:hypothetical protein